MLNSSPKNGKMRWHEVDKISAPAVKEINKSDEDSGPPECMYSVLNVHIKKFPYELHTAAVFSQVHSGTTRMQVLLFFLGGGWWTKICHKFQSVQQSAQQVTNPQHACTSLSSPSPSQKGKTNTTSCYGGKVPSSKRSKEGYASKAETSESSE